MSLKITLKGGKGSGWHAPPRGTHSGDKHRAVGSGKSAKPNASHDRAYVAGHELDVAKSYAAALSDVGAAIDPDDKMHDMILEHIGRSQGYNGLPEIVTKDEMDAHVAAGNIEMYRGTNKEYADELANGAYYLGKGMHGSGIYASGSGEWQGLHGGSNQAGRYVTEEDGALLRMSLKTDAKLINEFPLRKLAASAGIGTASKAVIENIGGEGLFWDSDLGHFAALMGYDAVTTNSAVVIVNRTALRIQEVE